jgi:hypothetical protein
MSGRQCKKEENRREKLNKDKEVGERKCKEHIRKKQTKTNVGQKKGQSCSVTSSTLRIVDIIYM